MHYAAYNGHLEMTEYLIKIGCVTDVYDKKGRGAIHFAAYMGHDNIVKTLIEQGADVNAKVISILLKFLDVQLSNILHLYLYVKDRDLYTPLHAAAASGSIECMQILISAGADIEAQNGYGNTPLHIACLNGHADAVKELITNGVNIGKMI